MSISTQLYVHRSGRTARGHNEGLSVILVGPEDFKAYQNIRKVLNRGEEVRVQPFWKEGNNFNPSGRWGGGGGL